MAHLKTFIIVVLAVSFVLVCYEWYNKGRNAKYIAAARVINGLVASTAVKSQVSEFYIETGKFPSSNNELHLPDSIQFANQSLIGLSVSAGGVITLTFDIESGVKNGTIQLVPDVSNQITGIKWQCITNSYPDIEQCKYNKSF